MAPTLRRRLLDIAPSVFVIALAIVDLSESESGTFRAPAGVDLALIALSCAPLVARRRHPVLVTVATFVVIDVYTAAWYIDGEPPFEPFVVGVIACFALGIHADGGAFRRGLIAYGVLVVGGALVSLVGGQHVGAVIPALVWWTMAIGIGRMLREREGMVLALRDRSERLEREHDRALAQAALEERARIARELHDVIAHAVSLIVVQASAERRLLDSRNGAGGGTVDPAAARTAETLVTIEDAGREALGELRRLLGVLRAGDRERLAPQPGLAALPDLVAEGERAGQRISVATAGVAIALPTGLDLVAFRIVQEALTNARKHAPGAAADVRLDWSSDRLDIEVTDDGPGLSGRRDEIGHGLIGMRERASLYGGAVETGPGHLGGFRVHASLPLHARAVVRA